MLSPCVPKRPARPIQWTDTNHVWHIVVDSDLEVPHVNATLKGARKLLRQLGWGKHQV
jgi:hypothetical protein